MEVPSKDLDPISGKNRGEEFVNFYKKCILILIAFRAGVKIPNGGNSPRARAVPGEIQGSSVQSDEEGSFFNRDELND